MLHLRRLSLIAPVVAVLAGSLACGTAGDGDGNARVALPKHRPSWRRVPPAEGGSTTLVLDRMPMELDLPEHSRGVGEESGSWTLTDLTPTEAGWRRAPLPFEIPRGQRRFAPVGMEVHVDGVLATFVSGTRPVDPTGPAWRLAGSDLEVWAPQPPREVRVVHPGVTRELARLEWGASRRAGMRAEDFVRYGVSLGKDAGERVLSESREGLLLPAPATAVWRDVTLPEGARFEGHVTLAPTPLSGSRSDGAEAVLAFVTDGREIELGRITVRPGEARFAPWRIDLAAHAGKSGDLVLRTLPGTTTVDDHVFVGSPVVRGRARGEVRRVIVVGLDTLRPDHLGMYGYHRDTSPALDAWAAAGATVFDNAWTSAPRTRPSFRAATTGRLPLEAVCAENIGSAFDAAGFATAGIVANIHLNPRFDFQKGFDWWHLDGAAKVEDQVALARAWLDENRDRDAYLFLHIMDPHIFYVAPPPYADRFTSTLPPLSEDQQLPKFFNRSKVYQWMRKGRLTDLQKQHIVARYDAEVAYTSDVLADFLAFVDELPGQTTVVLHSDHGEEFWEHGGFEHNHTLYDDTTRAVLVIKPPGGAPGRSDVMASLPDIAPTIYELAGLSDTPPTDGRSLVPALEGAPGDPDRAIPIGYLQYDAERWGVVWRGHKYVLFTGSGVEELYDLAADPGETRNLAGSRDTSPWWQALAREHRVDAGHGWRVDVRVPPGTEVTFTLPAEALGMGVLDPESVTRKPVNQEWGEVPPIQPDDVGTVERIDARTWRFVAGRHGEGVLWVRYAEPVPAGGEVVMGDTTVPLTEEDARVDTATFRVRPGVVVVPGKSEAQLMAECLDLSERGSEQTMSALKALGYVEMHDDHEPPAERERAARD